MTLSKTICVLAVSEVLVIAAVSLAETQSHASAFFEERKWFTNPVAGLSSASVSADGLVIAQKGCITHQDRWRIKTLRFGIQFHRLAATEDAYLFILQFAKARRSSFYGETHHREGTNDSYGLAFSKDGRIFPVRFGKNGEMEVLGDGFVVFDPFGKTSVELQMEYTTDRYFFMLRSQNSAFAIFSDDARLDPAGYVTLLNAAVGLETHLSDVEIDALQIPADTNARPMPVYFLDCFDSDKGRFIHWRYNERTQDYAGVNIYERTKRLAHVSYPADRFVLPERVGSDELTVKSVDIDGDESDASVVKLNAVGGLAAKCHDGRIAVQAGTPYARLINGRTKEEFIVRGVNYVRLTFGDHSNFTAANSYLPDLYDPYDAETMLKLLKHHGYNTVRVFLAGRGVLNPGIGGYPDFDEPVYKPYLDNFIDFLTRARTYGIYVLPTFGDGELPLNRYYRPTIEKMVEITGEEGQLRSGIPYNSVYLTKEGIQGRCVLIGETLKYVKQRDATLLESILAVQCQNELSLRANQWPFSLCCGHVTTANGKTYDMADRESRQRCMDEGLNHYHQVLSKAIKAVDPDLLVSEGTFTLRIVGKDPVAHKGLAAADHSDQRFPPTAVVLGQSGLDLIDIHIYHVNRDEMPAAGYRHDMASMLMYSEAMQPIRGRTPVIMGEFGAFRFVEPSAQQAQANILATRDACMEDQLNGYMIWTLDAYEQQEMHHALDGGYDFLEELSGNAGACETRAKTDKREGPRSGNI